MSLGTGFEVIHGDCLDVMRGMADASVDAIVCDPPYALTDIARTFQGKGGSVDERTGRERSNVRRAAGGFMGKAWDAALPTVEVWAEALRVAKPGAHLLAFGGTRTFHRLTCAIEDAGWEVRDCLSWLYGSGFPKSLDVAKAVDKAAGIHRGKAGAIRTGNAAMSGANYERTAKGDPVTAAAAAAAAAGLGTALKPAWEPIILTRKPLTGTVAANVATHGTGALAIDPCRIPFVSPEDKAAAAAAAAAAERSSHDRNAGRTVYGRFENGAASLIPYLETMDRGRWPANVVLDEEAAAMIDAQSGERPGMKVAELNRGATTGRGLGYGSTSPQQAGVVGYSDTGGASRFFYCAKASRGEREAGRDESRSAEQPSMNGGDGNPFNRGVTPVRNNHPTVKPVALMRWLCRLVTPQGGTVLDPFTGSGTTGIASDSSASSGKRPTWRLPAGASPQRRRRQTFLLPTTRDCLRLHPRRDRARQQPTCYPVEGHCEHPTYTRTRSGKGGRVSTPTRKRQRTNKEAESARY